MSWSEMKESWKAPIQSLSALESIARATLDNLNLDGTAGNSTSLGQREIKRYLPSIQINLLTNHLPTFAHALEGNLLRDVKALFAPERLTIGLANRRLIGCISYRTISSFLISKPAIPLPRESRAILLDILENLAQYSIDDIHWTVYGGKADDGEGSKEESARSLEWEETVSALISLPGKVANAIGRWSAEGRIIDVPATLTAPEFFDQVAKRLESLLYELSQSKSSTSHLLLPIQRLSALGFIPQTPMNDRAPSFWRSCLPSLLRHLHPDPTTSLPAYPPSFLPAFISSLPSSTLNNVIDSLLHHLAWNINDLSPEKPEEAIKRFAEVLTLIIGPAEKGGEVVDIVIRSLFNLKGRLEDQRSMAIIRGIVAWVGTAGTGAIIALLDEIMNAWTDTKYIKYALYAQQFSLTYALLCTLSLLPVYQPNLVALSHRGKFLTAMQTYIAHPDPSIRRLGMLVAEVISERTIEETGDNLEYSEKDEIDELKAGLEGEDEPKARPAPRGGKRLRFGPTMWEGHGEGKNEARWLRSSVGTRDNDAVLSSDNELWYFGWKENAKVEPQPTSTTSRPEPRGRPQSRPKKEKKQAKSRPKIVMLDDEQAADTLEGYDMPSPSSSRSPSPTPSYLEEVAADPSLALGATQDKKVTRPVYISQLIALVKEREKPECIEMALKYGESLIRAKRSFGGELEENAINLASMIVALNDPFNLDDFDQKRQGMINALVACSPKNVAPYLADLYFTGQFSLHQRSVILTALSMGARELAGLPVPLEISTRKVDFPSKILPKALHNKYAIMDDFINQRKIEGRDSTRGQIEAVADDLRGEIISKGAKKGEETVPALARQKQLRVSSSLKRTAIPQPSSSNSLINGQDPVVGFKDVGAEYFILPLINHFWTAFNDSQTREQRSRLRNTTGSIGGIGCVGGIGGAGQYRGSAGTGMIFSPMALEKFLMTLVILLHASRHSNLFLSVLAPESMELGMIIALRHKPDPNSLSSADIVGGIGGGGDIEEKKGKESGVIGAALELCLVVLDASTDLDGGRTLVMQKGSLISAVGEWAGELFKREERGGGGIVGSRGMREGRVRSGAAGVVVKVSEILEKWGRYGGVA